MHGSPNGDRLSEQPGSGQNDQIHHTTNGGSSQAVGAAAAAQQPKVVQTAFIHKLYKLVFRASSRQILANLINSMLEDQSIQHLISWSGSNESFVMSPSSEFSKVLA